MKHTRLALVLVITSLAATPAIAASLTMLQFGSFETRAEAEKRLSDVSKKHAATLAKLGSTIREVKLPPDNLTVYRTQAGPIENRTAAQAICATLASAGDECYIVQTAMVASADIQKPAASAVEASASAAVAEVKTELADAAPLKADLTSKLSTLNETPTRDARNLKALESVAAPTLATLTPSSVGEPSAEMKSALDKAADEQTAVEASVNTATAKVEQKARPSFWSRLNPFSGDKPKPVVAAPVKVEDPNAAPVQAVTSQPLEAPVAAIIAPSAEPVVVIPPAADPIPALPSLAAVVPQPVASATLTPALAAPSATMDTSPVIMQAEPLRLPPPPAPLKARDRELLATAQSGQPTAAPTQTGSLPAIDVKPLPPSGTVQVEEAKRVPVTSATGVQPTLPPASAVPTVVTPLQPAVPLNPSATDGIKTIWAQIGPFADNDAALSYWAKYRQANPDFPVVRVRVTTPLAQQVRGSNQSWLRVGPVTRAGFVRSLCASVVTPTSKLRCGTVSDMGFSSSAKTAPDMLPSSRYAR